MRKTTIKVSSVKRVNPHTMIKKGISLSGKQLSFNYLDQGLERILKKVPNNVSCDQHTLHWQTLNSEPTDGQVSDLIKHGVMDMNRYLASLSVRLNMFLEGNEKVFMTDDSRGFNLERVFTGKEVITIGYSFKYVESEWWCDLFSTPDRKMRGSFGYPDRYYWGGPCRLIQLAKHLT